MGLQKVYLGAFIVVFTIWLLTFAYLIVNRLLYEVRFRAIRTARDTLADPELQALPAEERAERIEDLLKRLPRRAIDRVAADASTPLWASEVFSLYLRKQWGVDRLLRDAARHRGEIGKWRRVAALRILSHDRSPEVFELLKRAVHDRDRDVAGAAVMILGKIDDRDAAQILIDALRVNAYSPSRIATPLDHFSLPIDDLLRPLLHDPVAVNRFWASTLLSRYRDVPGIDREIASLVRDREPNVRKAVVQSLGKMGGAHAAAVAATLIDDEVWYVRAHAARAIGDLRRVDLASKIMPLLADREWWVRLAAKEALVAIGPDAWPHVLPGLESEDRFARNGAAEVLQNLGLLDEVLFETVTRGNRKVGDLEALLRKINQAGGDKLMEALIGRANPQTRRAIREIIQHIGLDSAGAA